MGQDHETPQSWGCLKKGDVVQTAGIKFSFIIMHLNLYLSGQGGMFVFKGKQLLYARKDEGTGDHAPLDDVFNVCCNVSVA